MQPDGLDRAARPRGLQADQAGAVRRALLAAAPPALRELAALLHIQNFPQPKHNLHRLAGSIVEHLQLPLGQSILTLFHIGTGCIEEQCNEFFRRSL